jgi:F1F0 ATPase subunit 2
MDVMSLLVLGAAAGAVAGGVFFGGLAWTLRRLPHARSPGVLVAASLVVRLAVVAGAAVVVVERGLVAAAGLLAGVLVVRTFVVRRLAPDDGGR